MWKEAVTALKLCKPRSDWQSNDGTAIQQTQTTTWRILAQLVDWHQHNTPTSVNEKEKAKKKKGSDKAIFFFFKYSISARLGNNQDGLMELGVNPLYTFWEILFWGLSYVTDEVLQIKVRTAEAPKLSAFSVQPNII